MGGLAAIALGAGALLAACGSSSGGADAAPRIDGTPEEPDASDDAAPPCALEEFEGDALADRWSLLAGGLPTHQVGDSRLLVTDAPFADTPSVPGESWINDMDTDRGNQIAWAHDLGTGDFSILAELGWQSAAGERAIAGVAVAAADGTIAAWAGLADASLEQPGSARGAIRVADQPDLSGGPDLPAESGGALVTLERVGGQLTAYADGIALVEGPSDADIAQVSLLVVPYRDPEGAGAPFGSFEVHRVEVCRAPAAGR